LLFVPKGMDPETVVQWERKIRSPQEVETSLAALPAAEKSGVTPISEKIANPLPVVSDHKTGVQPEGKVRSLQEVETSLARLPVTEKPLVTPISHNNRNSSPLVSDSDHKARKSSSVDFPKAKREEVVVAFKTNRPVTIRENPRFSSKKVHEADEDTRLSVLEDRGDWLKVSTADAGLIGFVRKEFVSPLN
jgi:Bacterial SH3 domain